MAMKKLYVDIADEDRDYVARLARYVRSDSDWRDRISLRVASTLEGLRELTKERTADVLIVQASWYETAQEWGLASRLAMLSLDGEETKPHVWKFQPVPALMEQILGLSVEGGPVGELHGAAGGGERGSRVVAVYSASGGTGKTTLCLHLLRAWKRERLRALYISLETVPSPGWYGSGDWEQTSSRFLYALQHQPDRFREQWPDWVRRHGTFEFDTLPPFMHLMDGLSLSAEEVGRCLSWIKASGMYDMILVDLDSGLNERVMGAMRGADDLVWLEPGDAIGHDKSRRMLDGLQEIWEEAEGIRRKIRRVGHRTLSSAEAIDGKDRAGSLPYISEWKQVSGWSAVWNNEAYATAVTQLHRSVWARST